MASEQYRINQLHRVVDGNLRGFVVLKSIEESRTEPIHHFFMPTDVPPEVVQASLQAHLEANAAVYGIGGVLVKELFGSQANDQIRFLEAQVLAYQP